MNSSFPELKDSADLLVSENQVTGLEEVQRLRVLTSLDAVKPKVKAPHRIGQGLLILATGILAVTLLPAASVRTQDPTTAVVSDNSPSPVLSAAEVSEVEVQAVPPAYTGIQAYPIQGAHFKVPANS